MKTTAPVIRIGISSCLLGEEVRFDGGHKHDTLLTETFGRIFRWVPVCPEVELGLGTPRESLRLVGSAGHPRLVAPRSGADHTAAMLSYAGARLGELGQQDLHGYILKKNSPSCGMTRVRVYGHGGQPARTGRGLFAGALLERFPTLPVEEEGRLRDATLRENFVERVFCRYRWLQLSRCRPSAGKLVEFHSRHKLTLLSHCDEQYRKLGRLVSRAGATPIRQLFSKYENGFFETLRITATPRKHANVLYHLLGFLKDHLSSDGKEEMIDCIEEYRKGLLPLIVPVTLFKHHFRRSPVSWVMNQTYLNPYPSELMLRNRV